MSIAGARVCPALVVVLGTIRSGTYGDGEASGHSIEIVWMLTHGRDFRNDRFASPFDAEDHGQLLKVLSGRFSYREYGVS